MGRFFYSVRRGGEGHPDGGPTRRQKADGRMPVPRSFNEGGFAQGNEAQRNQSLRCYPTSPPCGFVGQARISRCSGIFYFALFARIYAILRLYADCFTYSRHNFGHKKYVYMCNPFACFTL